MFFYFLETCKIDQSVSITWHCFLHSLRCSRAVSYTDLLFCTRDIVGCVRSRQRAYTNEQC